MSLSMNKVDVSGLPKSGKTVTLEADSDRLRFLTENTEADEVHKFAAVFTVKPWKLNGARLTGSMNVSMQQTCVASLEPMTSDLSFEMKRYFLPDTDPVFNNQDIIDGELVIDPDADDLPDLLDGKMIDLWEVIVEELNLYIDPFPRMSAFELEGEAENEPEADTHKPFSELKALITEKKSGK